MLHLPPYISRHILRVTACLTTILLFGSAAQAQSIAQSELPQGAFNIALDAEVPLSADVVSGVLDNGLHYYIIENNEPANRAELRFVVDAGSVLEDDSQIGLAHFLEHMAFNGTEHFEKQSLVAFMESLGMQLGPGVNATTSFDETTYHLRIPTDNPANMETAFQIMEDWATALTLEPEEIEMERGIVIEEWRQGQGVESRILDRQIPVLLKGSQYVLRKPIGTLQNLRNFNNDDLRRFYEDWYRPELMAVVAVGAFDAQEIERLVYEHFDDIPAPESPLERPRFAIPEQEETQFSVVTDPELPITQVALYHVTPAEYDWTAGGYRKHLVDQLYNAMLNTRLQEMTLQADAPFFGAASQEVPLVRSTSLYLLGAVVEEGGVEQGLQALLEESARVEQHGFSEQELERQKAVLMRTFEQAYTNNYSRDSASLAAELIRSYLTGESVPGLPYETALVQRFIPEITLEEVNRVASERIGKGNLVVSVTAPAKDGPTLPTEEALAAVMEAAGTVTLAAREQTTEDKILLEQLPEGSPIIAEQEIEGGITQWELANGVKVILKPTDFKQDEIVFSAFSPGGTSIAEDEDLIPAQTAITLIANSGLGEFTTVQLQQELAGKIANVIPTINNFEEGFQGNGTTQDLELLMQLIYLRATAPRADPQFYQILQTQLRNALQNRSTNPAMVFEDTFNRLLYQDHPRRQPPSVDMIDHTDLDKSLAFYRDRYSDAGDFTFIFVGSIDLETMRPLVETYLGGLPAGGREESWVDHGVRLPEGVTRETLHQGQGSRSSTRIAFSGPFDIYNRFERTQFQVSGEILQTRLRNVMREEMGGTYNVLVNTNMIWKPKQDYIVQISFAADPARMEELNDALFTVIATLKEQGPTEQELHDAQQAILRRYEGGLQQNNNWVAQIQYALYSGVEPLTKEILSFPETVEALTIDSVKEGFRRYLNTDNYVQLTLLPEED